MSQLDKTRYPSTQIKLKEPFWPQRRSHCSVINLAHVEEPFVAPPSKTELYAIWLHDGTECPNGSPRWARLITEHMAPSQEPFGLHQITIEPKS